MHFFSIKPRGYHTHPSCPRPWPVPPPTPRPWTRRGPSPCRGSRPRASSAGSRSAGRRTGRARPGRSACRRVRPLGMSKWVNFVHFKRKKKASANFVRRHFVSILPSFFIEYVSEKWIKKIMFWFTIEFGLVETLPWSNRIKNLFRILNSSIDLPLVQEPPLDFALLL